MIGDHFIGPIEVDNPHNYQEILDPREVEARRRGKSPPICCFTNRVIYTHLPFRIIRSILRNRQDRTGIIYPRMEEQADLISHWTRYYWDAQGPQTISLLEDKIEQVRVQPVGICHLQATHSSRLMTYSAKLSSKMTVGITLNIYGIPGTCARHPKKSTRLPRRSPILARSLTLTSIGLW